MSERMHAVREMLAVRKVPSFLGCLARLEAATEKYRRAGDLESLVALCLRKPIAALQVPEELFEFARLVSERRPARVLEIGTCGGGTLCLFCQLAIPDAHIISVDLPGGNFGGGYRLVQKQLFRRFARGRQKLAFLRADSHRPETLAAVVSELRGQSLDLLFIDGDHSYDGVRRGFELYSPLVREGGIVALHDIVECTSTPACRVAAFWKEIKDRHAHREIVHDTTQGWAGIGVLFV